ncbi:bacillithiol system redox-active protein YtxJ [Paenibacillus sp. GSMTC-2017]|uniref:bacillithiol system redox-active protein YtxJ n=1 Tax=Paenibacillus sp. GSMTC-2017 TaxID=2794350 RepID=UPI0018D7BEFD|nr:bacillithiol system redox-active protein YtxJ [Paenibacillus sp. GSMTC-2017]MBH5318648.1 bacillithiol system redox-active protein YtxJ [Paenibacillus sp. GSMTC-2017]
MSYREITSIDEWNSALQQSETKPVVVFKHSTTCPVSSNAHTEFNNYLEGTPRKDIDFLFVKVIESRPISNQIAEDTGVKHESPQIIFIEKGTKVWTASHWSITKAHISAVLD